MFGRKLKELKETVRQLKCHVESLDFRVRAIEWVIEDLGYKQTDDAQWRSAEQFLKEPKIPVLSAHDRQSLRSKLVAVEQMIKTLEKSDSQKKASDNEKKA